MNRLLLGSGCGKDIATQEADIPAAFRNAIAERRSRTFDTRILDLPQLGSGWIEEQQWDARVKPVLDALVAAHGKYDAENDTIDQQIEELRPFLAAGVNLKAFQGRFQEAKKCPFCLTQNARTLPNLLQLYRPLADTLHCFDNSGEEPLLIFKDEGGHTTVYEQAILNRMTENDS